MGGSRAWALYSRRFRQHRPLPGERELFEAVTRSSFDATGLSRGLAESRLAFALSRYDEGERTVAFLRREYPDLMARPGLVVLDLGSGNGGMLFPFAGRARLVALDVYIDQELVAFRHAASIPLLHLLGKPSRIPLASGSVDLVLMAETLEHLAEPRLAGEEIARILTPGGVCLVSTRRRGATGASPCCGRRFVSGCRRSWAR